MRRKTQGIRNMPIKSVMCATCPFGPDACAEVRESVEQRILTNVSQTCHSTGVVRGRRDTHLCRGARNFQIPFFHRIGFLSEPTDECWFAKLAEIENG